MAAVSDCLIMNCSFLFELLTDESIEKNSGVSRRITGRCPGSLWATVAVEKAMEGLQSLIW